MGSGMTVHGAPPADAGRIALASMHARPVSEAEQPAMYAIVRELATAQRALTHAGLDELPDSKPVRHLRSVLVATGALPHRDEHLIRLEHWITVTLADVYVRLLALGILVDPAIPGVHVRRPDSTMLVVMAAITLPGLADMVIDRRARLLGPEGLVRETIALVTADPSRVAAQVVSGIGFLGAGSILLRGSVVRGLTTAASIWTVAAIGLAIGGGLYFAGIASTAIILIILAGVKPLEEAYRARNQSFQFHIRAERGKLTPDVLKTTLGIRRGQVKRFITQGSSKVAR